MLVAILNYVNLATGFSLQRESAHRIHRILVGSRVELALVQIAESMCVFILSSLVALGLLHLDNLSGRLDFLNWEQAKLNYILGVTASSFGIAVGLISGVYAAFQINCSTDERS